MVGLQENEALQPGGRINLSHYIHSVFPLIFSIPPENDRIDNIQTGVLVDLLKNMAFTFHQNIK